MSDQLQSTGNETGSTGTAGKTGQTSGEGDQTNYQAAYKGLQVKYEKLKGQFDTLELRYNEEVANHNEAKQGMTATEKTVQKLQAEIDMLKAQSSTQLADLSKKDRIVARQRLIMSEYPDLADLEGDGLLPTAEDDVTLKAALEKLRTRLKTRVGQETSKKLQGTGPEGGKTGTGTTGTSEDSLDYVWDKMVEARNKNSEADYIKWRDKHDALLEAQH